MLVNKLQENFTVPVWQCQLDFGKKCIFWSYFVIFWTVCVFLNLACGFKESFRRDTSSDVSKYVGVVKQTLKSYFCQHLRCMIIEKALISCQKIKLFYSILVCRKYSPVSRSIFLHLSRPRQKKCWQQNDKIAILTTPRPYAQPGFGILYPRFNIPGVGQSFSHKKTQQL